MINKPNIININDYDDGIVTFFSDSRDGWADRSDVVTDFERQALGSITVRIHSPYVSKFDSYYFALSPLTNTRNPWFQEFWENKFGCRMPSNELKKNITFYFDKKTCTGYERLADKYKQEPKLSFVIKAIKTMALALHQFKQDICGMKYAGPCPKMFPFNGTQFYVRKKSVNTQRFKAFCLFKSFFIFVYLSIPTREFELKEHFSTYFSGPFLKTLVLKVLQTYLAIGLV